MVPAGLVLTRETINLSYSFRHFPNAISFHSIFRATVTFVTTFFPVLHARVTTRTGTASPLWREMTTHAQKDLPASILHIRTVTAVRHVRGMRGQAQSQLMYCSDGSLYVVKFTNNPQHVRMLANEMLASLLARHLGLPVAEGVIVKVDASFVRSTPGMTMHIQSTTVPCQSGLQFGSRYVVEPSQGTVFDYLPPSILEHVQNRHKFWEALAFDKWTCNSDFRQAAFWKGPSERLYTAAFIDQGYCFNGRDWTLLDIVLRGGWWS